MKTHALFLLVCFLAYTVSAQAQETQPPKQSKLLKKPRVYTAIVKSDEELIPSQSYPAVAPVIRPVYTGYFPYAPPVIIPHVQPYEHEYGNLKALPDYGEESYSYPSKDLKPPAPNQPITYKAHESKEQFEPKSNDSISSERIVDYDSLSNQGSPQRFNYEGDLTPTALDDSYFPEAINTKSDAQSNDYGSFLQPPPPPSRNSKQTSDNLPPQDAVNPFQSFYNYQPENSDIPNVPPPPLPVAQNSNNSTKKKVDYPNAPPTLFAL
uniref:Uncharacterized protein n=1 Tax=Cacopsylla melanoneura TaxID=428564 RepID=A0A8D8UXC6_9HEMI